MNKHSNDQYLEDIKIIKPLKTLTKGLSRKIWQKLIILKRDEQP